MRDISVYNSKSFNRKDFKITKKRIAKTITKKKDIESYKEFLESAIEGVIEISSEENRKEQCTIKLKFNRLTSEVREVKTVKQSITFRYKMMKTFGNTKEIHTFLINSMN